MATTDLGELLVRLSADLKNLEGGLKKARNELSGFQGYAQGFASSLKKTLALAGVAVGLYQIAGAVKSFAKDAAMTGARTETLRVAMEQVGKNAGLSAQSLNYFVSELKAAGITSQEAMTAVTKFLTSGLSLDRVRELATRARDIAVVAGTDTSEAFSRLLTGILTGQSQVLRSLLVPISSLEAAWKNYAAQLGKTKDELTQVERAQATLNEVLRVTTGFAGAAAAADETVGKQLGSMKRYAEEAKNALWALFQPAMLAGIQAMSQAWKDLEKWALANQDALAAYGQAMGEFIVRMAQGIRTVIQFSGEIKSLLKLLLELWVASKVAGGIAAIAAALSKASAQGRILMGVLLALKNLIGSPWKLVITISLVGVYEGIKKIDQMVKETPALGASMLLGEAEGLLSAKQRAELDKTNAEIAAQRQAAAEKGKKAEAPAKSPEEVARQAIEEAAKAQEKALKEAMAGLGEGVAKAGKGGGGAGGAGARASEDILRYLTDYLEAKRQLELQEAEDSYQTFQAAQEKKRAELKLWLAEGKVTGQEYYAALKAMAEDEAAAAIQLIEGKIAKEKEAYEWAQKEVADKAKKGEISPEAQDLALKKLAVEHTQRLKELEGEALREKIGLQREHLDLLRQEYDNRQRIADLMASGREEAALGPIAEKEAEINRLLRERYRLKEELIRLGASESQVAEFDRVTSELEINKRFGDQIRAYTDLVSGFFGGLVDAIMDGERDLRKSLNQFFKSLFKQALEPAMKQMMQWLTDFFKGMFNSIGGAVMNGIMAIVGLVGMLLTGGGGKSTWSPAGVQSGVSGHEAVRGIVAGETSIPIAKVHESLREAVAPHLSVLRQIEANTRGGPGGGEMQMSVRVEGVEEAIRESLETYFREYLVLGAGA
jgi:hypothetical protein